MDALAADLLQNLLYSASSASLTSQKDAAGDGGEGGGVNLILGLVPRH
jgi:hypothetical protein